MSADVLTVGVLMTGTDILSKGDDGLRTVGLDCTGEVVGGATVCAGPILSSVSVSAWDSVRFMLGDGESNEFVRESLDAE